MILDNIVGRGNISGQVYVDFSKGILSWSLMPGMLCVLSMREGLVVRKSYRMCLHLVGSRIAW